MDPAAIPLIYGVRLKLDKGDAYVPFRQAGVTTSLLSIPDEKTHAKYRKLVSNAYSLTSLRGYEPYVDEMVNRLVQVCDHHAETQMPLNLSLWCHYYCFDVVSKLTLGQPLGFLEGRDAYSLIQRIKAFGAYTGVVSQMPWLHKIFQDNPLMRKTKPSPFMQVVRKTVDDRLKDPDVESKPRPDLLSHFIATHREYPDTMDPFQVLIFTSGNLIAGGLSPSKTFNEICYFLVTNGKAQDKLFQELEEVKCTFPANFDEVRHLGYLEGVIKEALRLHSSTSFNLQRVTGPNGLQLPNGTHIPPRINIGSPAGAINQDIRVFGDDAEVYKPERWMQGNESLETFQQRRNLMERTELSFGQGSRTCIGKNIAILEMFKAVATLMGQFTFEPAGTPKKDQVFVTVHRREKIRGVVSAKK
ncbi:uncharacterized protein Z518_09647 [Rhinocladiella mackenziei CBS 650.93]|uniref:Rhinocladiella mackenziei CBS 650.93 unplaced genomic scaffold supercont1.8, whole genome shotgun sequence n=1 Tax=Rhinocladiella mackenziei CBS 650.93 TaxID=1442369 RepID=A0A0D2FEZ6_9EURO|nr:uncharacterized protein Z518_09647 [Rhinocladiella mackenziei CBS 650.93]KIX00582.1 hypothetical protein Z518_09647 [Rhinocladiella mackenziei CBS 650.93]